MPIPLKSQYAGTRRQFLVLPLKAGLAATAVSLALPTAAQAIDFSLPKLEDLREKWSNVGMGATDALVVQVMGSPNGRTETQTMGVPHMTLEWKDIKGFRYTARFLGGRLYAKQASDTR